MNKRGKRRVWWGLFLLFIVGAAVLVGYLIGKEKGPEEKEVLVSKELPTEKEKAPKLEVKIPTKKEPSITKEIEESRHLDQEDYCREIENQILEFFRYLNKKNYVQHLEAGVDTYDHFKRLIGKLSSKPPIPAGEGVDSKIITRNIFFFFRMLDKNDLRLIREIIQNEADTLEMNLELFFKWLMLGDRCPDPKGIRPSPDVLYQYAGFFLNTIGGRAYLFRRSTGLRLLISYYCLLIIHEADKRGENSYGIDIFPDIAHLAREISFYPDFQFQSDYIAQLTGLQNYYIRKR